MEPLADVDVNTPGVIVMLVAPAAAQLNVLLAPEVMPVGLAEKKAILGFAGWEPLPDEFPAPQLASARQPNTIMTGINELSFNRCMWLVVAEIGLFDEFLTRTDPIGRVYSKVLGGCSSRRL